MKREFGYGFGDVDFVIYSHSGLFYLKQNDRKIARSDNIKILKSFIDGFVDGFETANTKNRYQKREAVQE